MKEKAKEKHHIWIKWGMAAGRWSRQTVIWK